MYRYRLGFNQEASFYLIRVTGNDCFVQARDDCSIHEEDFKGSFCKTVYEQHYRNQPVDDYSKVIRDKDFPKTIEEERIP